MEPIDLEWLGASWHRIDRLYEAEQRAIAAGAPPLASWHPGGGRGVTPGGGARPWLWHGWLGAQGRRLSEGAETGPMPRV
jgi:hypothetical protein